MTVDLKQEFPLDPSLCYLNHAAPLAAEKRRGG